MEQRGKRRILIMVVITTAMMSIAQVARVMPANARSASTMCMRAFRSTRYRSFDALLNRVIPNLLIGGMRNLLAEHVHVTHG